MGIISRAVWNRLYTLMNKLRLKDMSQEHVAHLWSVHTYTFV